MRMRIFFLLLIITVAHESYSQPSHTFTQYTSEDGLFQKTIQCILQDHKGFMWFATWDGLYKFDGYKFKNYKAYSGDNIELSNNRMGYLKEDRYGYIWVQNYDHKVYRFDPNKEQFQPIPYADYSAQEIYVFPSGDVWIATTRDELIHVKTDPSTYNMTAVNFFKNHHIPYPKGVNKIYQDKQQNQWILSNNGLYKISTTAQKEEVTSFLSKYPFYDVTESKQAMYFSSDDGEIWLLQNNRFRSQKLPTRSAIKFVRELTHTSLFIGTDNDGFIIYDTYDNSVQQYNKNTHNNLKDNQIKGVYVDKNKEIWIKLNIPGITHFNPKNCQISYFILHDKYGKNIVESRMEMDICEDIHGFLWVHPPGGGFAWYDRLNNKLIPFYNPSLQTGWNSSNRVASTFSDKQGNLWFCSFGNGLEKVTFNTSDFHLHPIYPEDSEHPGNNTRAIYQDRDGYIWVGNKDKIIRIYDKNLKHIGNLTFQGTVSPNSADELGMAYSFVQDRNGTIWIGTKGKGLMSVTPTHSPLKFQLQHFLFDNNNVFSLSGNEVYSLHEDSKQRLWIATFDGGINYLDLKSTPKDLKFINHRNRLKKYPIGECFRSRFVTFDSEDRIWIGTSAGLLMCENADKEPEQMTFRHFSRIPGDKHSLSNNDVHNVFFNKKNEMFVATFGGGVNKRISFKNGQAKFQAYTTKDGLSSDIILSIEEDAKGKLWLATEDEICRFDPVTDKFTNYQSKFFPRSIRFNEGAALRTNDDKLIFGTVKGIFYFSPDSIKDSDYIPPIIFTGFVLAEKKTGSGIEKLSPINIDDAKFIKLSHEQNGFSIQFAALDMKYPNSILYAYQLEGFDKRWNYVGNQQNATYTNLPKGNYTLKVMSTNSNGVWVDNMRSLDIEVQPSFWETAWAYLLYFLVGTIIIFVASYILFTIFRLKDKVTIEQEISDIKLRFFTNISHELRTPLTLIAGPVEHVLQRGNLQDEDKDQLVLVKNNTNRMLHLVNQILDFRKIQNKKMKMRVQQVDLIPFVKTIMGSFNNIADKHQIDFDLETNLQTLGIWVDADKLEKILFNLLSNAFKYTPQGKRVKVVIQDAEKEAILSVEDQGIGIAENKQKSLFIRFENLIDKSIFSHPSTGIGLSLVKELIDMHHGKIDVYSKQGEGSRFTIHLWKGKSHFDDTAEFILDDYAITDANQLYQHTSLSVIAENASEDINLDKETLLIVEDNPELRFFLKTIFIQYFNVIEAENGNLGLEKSKTFLPDIIISDVMMPEKDGIQLTQALREDINTSHIPIILLTAKSTIESKIQGMEYGADDYITKPFSAAYLKARTFNLLEQRKKLQALYCASLEPAVLKKAENENNGEKIIGLPELSPNDQKFMSIVMATIEKNIDNGSLKVEDVATEVNMSRSVFFKKLKSLTGLSPIEFLKDMRMKRAAQLIETNEYTMSQISYMVGINDSHYFSKCFKLQYGMSPTEYKENKVRTL